MAVVDLLKCYRDMLFIRKFEEKAGQLYVQGMICGFCHLYIGQEAVAVGMSAILSENDSVITSYRDHGMVLAIGSDPNFVMAELMGKATGVSKGKGGSMHIFDLEKKFYGGHGIVGGQVPLGAGLAFANKYNKVNGVTFAYLGDGAINQGQVHETFNMAALWKLPIVFVIENNEYGMGTSVERASANPTLYKRGESSGVPGREVDAMDIMEVIKIGKETADLCRAGGGPFILEMKTYRYRGHSVSDPATYRSKDDVASVKQNRDSIESLAKYLIDRGDATKEKLDNILSDIKKEIEEIVKYSKQSIEPDQGQLYSDIMK